MKNNIAKRSNDELTIRQRMKLTKHNILYISSSIAIYLFVLLCLLIAIGE
jgi:uncharacterized membrane protein YidH (DUF202 family)